ncbi:MAG: protein kinase domain-containing protein, partial [Gemmatimonadaceae bacterium]
MPSARRLSSPVVPGSFPSTRLRLVDEDFALTTIPRALETALRDRYRIERELGAGGMATVYLAEDVKHDRRVALKVLRPDLAAVIGADRFLSEIKTTANLQHPHILALFNSGEAGGFVYYVMPYVEGESLRDRLNREKQLPIDEALRITTEVADALEYAHGHGVIHRDIKPENVLLHGGHALVADFGIALAVSRSDGATRMTETGMSLGTPTYMSPEQAMGEREISARSDVYALGAMLYEMLVGDPPFTGSTAQAIVAKVLTAAPASLVTQRHTVPPHVEAAVLKALEKLPADRFATAAQFAAALADASSSGFASASGGRAPYMKARRALGFPAAGALVIAALAVGAMTTAFLHRAHAVERAATRVMLEFPANEQPEHGSVPAPLLALRPDGSGLLYSGIGANGQPQLWFRRWDRLGATRYSQTLGGACCAVFSPGGDSVAYLAPPHTLQVLPLTGGFPATAADSGLTSVSDLGGGVDWGSDGMLYVSGLKGLLRVSPRGGTPEVVAPLDAQRGDLRYLWPAVLPGARGALVSVVPASDPTSMDRVAIGAADFRTGKVTLLLQGTRAIYAPTGHLIFTKANGALWAVPFDVKSMATTGPARELADTVAVEQQAFGDLSLSPGGALAYVKGVIQSYRLVWVNRNGDATPVARDLVDDGLDSPALSPDGKRIIVAMAGSDGKFSLWMKALDGSPKVRLTFDGTTNWRAAWRPGTEQISYLSDRGKIGSTSLRLFLLNLTGHAGVTKPDPHDSRAVGGATWSPDGKWLVFRTDNQESGNGDILAIRPGVDTAPRAIVATPAEELLPQISPDGRWMAYSSDVSGRREIYVRAFPDAAGTPYQVSTMGGTNPSWNPNGKELFFFDSGNNMVSVPVIPGPAFQVGQPRVLF